MNPDDKFDRIIKQKVSKAEFEFDENAWKQAASMIDAERAAKGGFKAGRMFLAIGGAFIGVTLLTLLTVSLLRDNEKSVSEVDLAVEQNTEQNSVSDDSRFAESNSRSVSEMPVKEGKIAEVSSNSFAAPAKDRQVSSEQNDPLLASQTKIVSNEKAVVSENDRSEAYSQKDDHSQVGQIATVKFNSSEKVSDPMNVDTRSRTLPTLGNNTKDVNNENDVSHSGSAEDAVSVEKLEMHNARIEAWFNEPSLTVTTMEIIRVYDDEYFKKNRRKLHFMTAEAGAAYNYGWLSGSSRDGRGINAYAGLNYGVYLSRKSSLTLGAHWSHLSHIRDPFYKNVVHHYDFGYTGTHTQITSTDLYFVSVPVKLYYNISRFGKLGAGITANFLTGAKNKVESFTIRDGEKIDQTEQRVKGVYEGMSLNNTQVSLTYNHRFNKRWCMNAEFNYGVSDLFPQKLTGNSAIERNTSVKLGVQFILFDK